MSELPASWRPLLARGGDDPTQTLRPDPTAATTAPTVADSRWWGSGAGGGRARTRFEVLALLGHGGMGQVLLARQQDLGREVAVKVLPEGRDDAARAAALRAEARIAGGLDHPGVVPVHDAGVDWFAMRRVRGETLEELLVRGLPLRELATILRKVADALVFAHDQGIVHRDVKPANIMVGAFGEVLLMDWGLAARLRPREDGGWGAVDLDQRQAAGGTPGYLAPEMARGEVERIGAASDVYLLGATLYRALCGKPPHAGGPLDSVLARAARNRVTPVPQLAPDSPVRLTAIAAAAMASDPTQRPDTRALRDALVAWLRSQEAEDQARAAAEEARRLVVAARAAPTAAAAYADWAAAATALDRARDLWSELPGLDRRRHEIAAARCALAMEQGDLGLAERVARRNGDPGLLEGVAAATERRRRHARRAVGLRLGALAALVLCLAGGGALLSWIGGAAEREAARRRDLAAQQLAAIAGTPGGDLAAARQRVELAYRALGLDADAPGVRETLRQRLLDLARLALETDDLATAREAADQLLLLFPSQPAVIDLVATLRHERHDPQARRQRELDTRRARLAALVDDARHRRGGQDWLGSRAEEIAGWDGTELAEPIAALVADDDPLVAALGIAVLARRSDLDDGGALATRLTRADDLHGDSVIDALARRDDPGAAAAVVAWLGSREDPWTARRAAVPIDGRLLAACRAATTGAPLAVLLALDQIDLAAARAGADPAALAAVARAAWWQRDDPALCLELCARLETLAPEDPWWRILRADHALVAGDAAAALAALGPDSTLPPAVRAHLLLGDEAAARAVADHLRAHFPPAPAIALHAVNAIEAVHGEEIAKALYPRLPERYWDHRKAVREVLASGRWRAAERLARVHSEQYHGQTGAPIDAAVAVARRGEDQRAMVLFQRALVYGPDSHSSLKFAARHSLGLGDHARTARLARRGIDTAGDHFCFESWALALTAARLDGDAAGELEAATAMLGAGKHGPDAHLAVRCALEHGRSDLVLGWLHGFQELPVVGARGLRGSVDTLLSTVPALRRQGWPGCEGAILARRLLREARVVLATPTADPARAVELVATARRHLDGDPAPVLELAATFLEAAAAADGALAAARALAAQAPSELVDLPWALALVAADQRWAEDGGALPLPHPAVDSRELHANWPRRPLVDWRPDAAQRDDLAAWLRRHGRSLVPDAGYDLATVEDWLQRQRDLVATVAALEAAP